MLVLQPVFFGGAAVLGFELRFFWGWAYWSLNLVFFF
jgi:hypothetical protein